MSEHSFLKIESVQKTYRSGPKDVRAVNGIDLEMERGRSLAIIGPSGAGKSTLLHILGGLDRPTSGKIRLDGIDIYKLPDSQRAKMRNERIGFVFQFYHLLPEFTALENVMLPALIKRQDTSLGFARDRRNKRQGLEKKAAGLLKSVGLENRMNHKPNELSGGESQRGAIARAIINEPEVLLCDEPTGNLDSKASESIYELLFEIKSKREMTLVIVTHDESISSHMDRTIRIKDGQIKT